MGQDRSRSRNADLMANLPLIRSVLLCGLVEDFPDRSQPEVQEYLQSLPGRCLALITTL